MQLHKDGEQKWFRHFGRFSILSLFITTALFAQSFAEFKRNEISSFEEYKDKKDAAFNKYLRSQWEEYTSEYSKALYKEPKPRTIPQTVPKKLKSVGPTVSVKLPKKPKRERATPQSESKKSKDIYFDFFGERLGFDIDKNYKNARFYPQNQMGIVNFFNTLAHSDYESTLVDIKRMKKELRLNDWGLYLLINELAKHIYSYKDERDIFSWYIFNKLSYDVRLGLSGKHVVVMYYSKKMIYSTPRYIFNKKDFYLIEKYATEFTKKLYTYKHNYPDSSKPLDLSLKEMPLFAQNIQTKELHFKKFGKTYKLSYKYNKNLINFMATYPQADYKTYFDAPISRLAYDSLAKSLKEYIDTKHASVAINFVLTFVQKAFEYELDQEQFGREKVMFANETLYYQKSDCEDRAILFARLIKTLFGVTVIGVQYSDHMATALYIPLRGDSVKSGNRRFVIADPTYINANIGESMPKYSHKIPESFITLSGE